MAVLVTMIYCDTTYRDNRYPLHGRSNLRENDFVPVVRAPLRESGCFLCKRLRVRLEKLSPLNTCGQKSSVCPNFAWVEGQEGPEQSIA